MTTYPTYCINLAHRSDRKMHMIAQLTALGMRHDRVRFPPLAKDPRGGAYGCWDSHMKVWADFRASFPKRPFCLVLEDDCVMAENARRLIARAASFVANHTGEVDILFLHNARVVVESPLNSAHFSNGYGLNSHAYFITRRYIEHIISTYGKLPDPTGSHIDYAINMDRHMTTGWLYTERAFYTNVECVTQLCEADGKSDNLLNLFDKMCRDDLSKHVKQTMDRWMLLRRHGLMTSNQQKDLLMLCLTTHQPFGEALGRFAQRYSEIRHPTW